MERWLSQNKIFAVGSVQLRSRGAPVDVFMATGAAAPAETILLHDLLVAKFGLPWFLRNGNGVTVEWKRGKLPNRADALLTVNSISFYVELDNGTESIRSQVVDRMAGYQSLPPGHFVLCVTTGQRRKETIARECRRFGRFLLLSTMEECRTDAVGPIWQSVHGTTTSLF